MAIKYLGEAGAIEYDKLPDHTGRRPEKPSYAYSPPR